MLEDIRRMARAPRAGRAALLWSTPRAFPESAESGDGRADAAGSERVVACDVTALDLHGSAAAALLDRQLADVPS
jgi:hypothetical protein